LVLCSDMFAYRTYLFLYCSCAYPHLHSFPTRRSSDLEFGRVKAFGEVRDVLPLYESFLSKWRSMSKDERNDYRQKVMDRDPAEAEYKKYGNLTLLDDDEELESSHGYTIRPVSRLAHLKGDSTDIFESPDSDANKQPAH